MGIISWIIIGLIAGYVGKLIYPGHQGGGVLATLGLGVLGSIVGGIIGGSLFGVAMGFSLPGLFFAILGAIICIFVWGLLTSKK